MSERAGSASAEGARPEGSADERAASAAVQRMFDSIAPRYDLLNHVLSFNVDRLWWWRTARRFRGILRRPEARVLDLCCGTGDMALALDRRRPPHATPMVAVDFSHPMLVRGARKFARRSIRPVEADALRLPFDDRRFDLVTSAFGFRNLASYEAGLREIHRVLKPGGAMGILDFSEPRGMLGRLYRLYFWRVLPAIGSVLSGVRGPYAYLPASVERFPPPARMLEAMRHAGFEDVSWVPYTFGIAGLYRGVRGDAPGGGPGSM